MVVLGGVTYPASEPRGVRGVGVGARPARLEGRAPGPALRRAAPASAFTLYTYKTCPVETLGRARTDLVYMRTGHVSSPSSAFGKGVPGKGRGGGGRKRGGEKGGREREREREGEREGERERDRERGAGRENSHDGMLILTGL